MEKIASVRTRLIDKQDTSIVQWFLKKIPHYCLDETSLGFGPTFHCILDKALSSLSPKQEQIIRFRFGINPDQTQKTLSQIALMFGLSRERIRQIEHNALIKLRHPARSNPLRPYYFVHDPVVPPRPVQYSAFAILKKKFMSRPEGFSEAPLNRLVSMTLILSLAIQNTGLKRK